MWKLLACNQSILKQISPGISLQGMMLKLKLLATSWEELTHWKILWCWEGSGAGGEGDDRGWDGWMASLTRWTWVWVNSGRWLWTGRPGMLRFMGLQGVGHNWVTELNCSWLGLSFMLCFRTQTAIKVINFPLTTPLHFAPSQEFQNLRKLLSHLWAYFCNGL